MADVEALARAIRDAVLIGPIGPNSRAVHAGGGMVSLTGSEASDAARALLDSDWLAAHDAATRADERALVLGEVERRVGMQGFRFSTREDHAEALTIVRDLRAKRGK